MYIKLIKLLMLILFVTGCTVSSPSAEDVKQATNNMFGALRISVVSIEDLVCKETSNASTFGCKYTTTMNDGSVLKSEGTFSYSGGAWKRIN